MGRKSVIVIENESNGQRCLTTAADELISEQRSATYQPHELDKVVDFEDEPTIIRYLMESKPKLDVIAIVGMPGLGKTTLARKIFNEEGICRKFPSRIWVPVSQKFNSRDTFLNILKELIPQAASTPSDEELITTIRRCLANKDFLLVMDDVWTVEDWKVLQKILPQENGKGKVLITSRQSEVAGQANIYRKSHGMSLLGVEKSLELLKLKVFDNIENCPPQLEVIGRRIANKCGGLPLAVVVIAGSLKNQFTKTRAIVGLQEKWSKVFDDVNEILQEDKDKSISNVLELSCNILSDEMRVCFLYTGLFPDNHEIPASTLTQLWIEEGFVRPNGRSLEESAEKILEGLINMNLLMVTRKNLDQVKTCGVHDLIREFCKAKAAEESLFRVIKESRQGETRAQVSEVQKFRRLCLHSDPSRFLCAEANDDSSVRSFLCFLEEPIGVDPIHISTIPFNVLRVLNCKSMKLGQFPKVSSLILLKHITLFIDNLDVLPEQISQLLNLRTLIVDTSSRSITVKANIWKMIQLRRLKTKAPIFLDDKYWTGKTSENLQTISRLSPGSCKETLLKRAPNLKTLGIQGEVANLFDNFSLKKLHLLRKLKLVNEVLSETAITLQLLPRPDCFPSNLVSLTLSNTCLTWVDHMPMFATMKALTVLKLRDNAFKGIKWNAEGNGFEKLQFLLIEDADLVIWNASDAHFGSLRWLVLKKCEALREIPKSLATHLEKLEIEHVKESATHSARTIQSIKHNHTRDSANWNVPFQLTIGSRCNL